MASPTTGQLNNAMEASKVGSEDWSWRVMECFIEEVTISYHLKEFARQRCQRKVGFVGEETIWARAKRHRMSELGELTVAQQGKNLKLKEE